MNRPLTEIELFQASMMIGESNFNLFTSLVTLLFGYLVLAHFVGQGLPRFIALTTTIIYSVFTLMSLWAWWNNWGISFGLCYLYGDLYPNGALMSGCEGDAPAVPWIRIIITAPAVIAWLSSVLYMHAYMRK